MNNPILRVGAAVAMALAIAYASAHLLGAERKVRWFKQRDQRGILNRRGMLGDRLNFGRPRTWQGLAVLVAMLVAMTTVGYALLFLAV